MASVDTRRLDKLPSHPGLLDWLASRLVDDGWSLKKLHRRIMLTQAYQMSDSSSGTSGLRSSTLRTACSGG